MIYFQVLQLLAFACHTPDKVCVGYVPRRADQFHQSLLEKGVEVDGDRQVVEVDTAVYDSMQQARKT